RYPHLGLFSVIVTVQPSSAAVVLWRSACNFIARSSTTLSAAASSFASSRTSTQFLLYVAAVLTRARSFNRAKFPSGHRETLALWAWFIRRAITETRARRLKLR